ncbi:energy transducer TonB [Hymenobacter yonginensis]|uniref:TonB family protein n=1 Tax=Hymenobacter yonginensis TaxID=748197 RepID=A0ABY7PPG0_9BACT|nr:energy transducer TonB [Hymenobacter yonginensis]WBO83880.1 TonB family protein [Hymenobacter yonginensis]
MKTMMLLALLCLLSGEAWAQARKTSTPVAAQPRQKQARKKPLPGKPHIEAPTLSTVTVVSDNEQQVYCLKDTTSSTTPIIYNYVRQMPAFPGGHEAMQAFLQKNLRWPENGGMICAEGRVFVNFIVGKEGRLREFKVLKELDPLLDAEALRVAQLLDGRFTPGAQDGRPVDVYYTVAVTFRIR